MIYTISVYPNFHLGLHTPLWSSLNNLGAYSKCYFQRGCIFRKLLMHAKTQGGCIPCKTQVEGTQVVPQEYANIERWRILGLQRSGEPCAKIYILFCHYAYEHSSGYIYADMPPCHHTERKANSTLEIFWPKCMQCILG